MIVATTMIAAMISVFGKSYFGITLNRRQLPNRNPTPELVQSNS